MEGEIVPVIEGSPAQLSFWKLAYETHGSAVLSFLTSRLRRREEAEDLLQETFIRAIRAGESLRDAGRVRPYLMTIAHRLVLNEARRKKPVLISDASPDDADRAWEIPDAGAESPEEIAISVVAEMIAVRRAPETEWRSLSKSIFAHENLRALLK